MNNFEEALEHIKILEKENHNLKIKLKAALWKLSSSSVEEPMTVTNIQVGDNTLSCWDKDREAAMQRFNKKLRKLAAKHKKERDAKK